MPNVTSETVETVRVAIETAGSLDRPRLVVPDGAAPEGVVRVVADERTYHAPIERGLSGDLELRGLYENARLARTRDGRNVLPEWIDRKDLHAGRSALLDIVVEGEQYGLRAPGERAVYQTVEGPPDSLASIAEDLDAE